jgi:hypothetical protein
LIPRETQALDWLLGLRYLTRAETTWIVDALLPRLEVAVTDK